MATDIHHGGGVGTYKTFSVIQRQALAHLQSGRTVISTVRGFDSIAIIKAVMEIEIPESSQIIFVDLETTEGIEKIRRWWEWVPVGAYIIIDEAQLIYPKSKRITIYDYPSKNGLSSEESAQADKRPNGFLQAFTMQRHYNWDISIITPNIKMLVPEIREVSQVAYEHKYMGSLLPWAKHGWREIQHAPMETGKTSPHPPVRYTADQRVYKIYKSTKTGNHSTSNAERSVFKNPKVISSLLFSALTVGLFIWLLFFKIIRSNDDSSSHETGLSGAQISGASGVNNGFNRDNLETDNVSRDVVQHIETTRFHAKTMAIVGKFFDEYIIEVGLPPDAVQFSTSYLFKNGVKLNIVSDCLIEMTFNDIIYNVRCPLHLRQFKQDIDKPKVEFNPLGALTGA